MFVRMCFPLVDECLSARHTSYVPGVRTSPTRELTPGSNGRGRAGPVYNLRGRRKGRGPVSPALR
ncbi:hypothetical protein GCM10010345_61650 [Streptomyces canarius]|uniref:Transposase n=1 Tax=Streptomyces canarius TaxID=285453 RepID=A0ABQ3CXP9_9ACTN|nr:hypothetical protein GCM10010345_61650 [Streptomyces canarius]